jgi:hypothetical protein
MFRIILKKMDGAGNVVAKAREEEEAHAKDAKAQRRGGLLLCAFAILA